MPSCGSVISENEFGGAAVTFMLTVGTSTPECCDSYNAPPEIEISESAITPNTVARVLRPHVTHIVVKWPNMRVLGHLARRRTRVSVRRRKRSCHSLSNWRERFSARHPTVTKHYRPEMPFSIAVMNPSAKWRGRCTVPAIARQQQGSWSEKKTAACADFLYRFI